MQKNTFTWSTVAVIGALVLGGAAPSFTAPTESNAAPVQVGVAQSSELPAQITSIDHEARAITLEGTGRPGAVLDFQADFASADMHRIAIDQSGSWQTTIDGVPSGTHFVRVVVVGGGGWSEYLDFDMAPGQTAAFVAEATPITGPMGAAAVSGTGEPGESVSVRTSTLSRSATVGADGRWTVTLSFLSARTPYAMVSTDLGRSALVPLRLAA